MEVLLSPTNKAENKPMLMRSPVGRVLYHINPIDYPKLLESGWQMYKTDRELSEAQILKLISQAFDSDEEVFDI